MAADAAQLRSPTFPGHDGPRIWLLTSGDSPLGLSLARTLLAHGDKVVLGVCPRITEVERDYGEIRELVDEAKTAGSWQKQLRIVKLDIRLLGSCQSTIAEVVNAFGSIDILVCCSSECVVGAVEELGATEQTRNLVREQFETNFFGPVNMIKSVLPTFRQQRSGHIVIVSAITGHLGTPGLGTYCSSQWALEGYCDSLAYEVAPFNIKTTILQPNLEVNVLLNKVSCAPPMSAYGHDVNQAPLFRDILSGLLDKLDDNKDVTLGDMLHKNEAAALYPPVTRSMKDALVAETVHALAAIGAHDNPPARHIVGSDGVVSVREKLKTLSEELEDFVEVSLEVDLGS